MISDAREAGGFSIDPAGPGDAGTISPQIGRLLGEIMEQTGIQAFAFDERGTEARLSEWLRGGLYHAFLARRAGNCFGVITLVETRSLYAEGTFGIIPELYVAPGSRSLGIGSQLVARAKEYGISRGWRRLEVTPPPSPAFERTVAFYESEGFAAHSGRKLRIILPAPAGDRA